MANAQVRVQLIPHARGHYLAVAGYGYCVKTRKQGRDAELVYWKCTEMDCPGTVNTTDNLVTRFLRDHNHPPSHADIKAKLFLSHLSEKAPSCLDPLPTLYDMMYPLILTFLPDKCQTTYQRIAGKGSYWISPVCKKRVYQYKCSWKHESNNKAVTYEGWYSYEPNSNQKCAVLYCGYRYSWNDFNCNDKAYYICEKQVPSPVIPVPIPRPLPRTYLKPLIKPRPKSYSDSDSSDSSEKKGTKKYKKYGKKSSSSSSDEKKKIKPYRKKYGSGENYNDGKNKTRYNKKSSGSNSSEKWGGGKSKRRYNKKSSSSSSSSDEKNGKRSYSKKIPSPPQPKPLPLPPKRY
ncbi:unnamed protein product [Mytilus coruscus]|uniref:C-type lectin domain-containing protein n=1 Tax=Mytilus coruscus TaxID=42192 RepID=A0A6J8C1X3_MYTCO|nr:unnamed protein product [Mytilus coruscus]